MMLSLVAAKSYKWVLFSNKHQNTIEAAIQLPIAV
jgi:hypothetical protein